MKQAIAYKKSKETQKALARQYAELNAMIEGVPLAMLLVDKDRRVRKANSTAEKFAGIKAEQMLGMRSGEALQCLNSLDNPQGCGFGPACGKCLVRRTLNRTFRKGTNFDRIEAKLPVNRQGKREELDVLISTSILNVSDEKLSLVCIEDVTERRRVRKQIEQLASFPKLNPNPVIEIDAAGKVTFANQATEDFLRAVGQKNKTALFLPKDIKDILEKLLNEKSKPLYREVRIDTAVFGESIYLAPQYKVVRIYAVDITERKKKEEQLERLNRTLNARSNSNKAIMYARDETDYLKKICAIITRDCGHAMVWVGFPNNDKEKSVTPVAYAGFEKGYLETLNVSWGDNERGHGPTGTAIRMGKPSGCKNMLTDPNFKPWRKEAVKRGYASSAVFPLKKKDKILGAMTIYSRQPDSFSEDETKLLAELANDVAYGITFFRLKVANKKAQEDILFASTHDILTGVYNRNYFEKQLEKFRKRRIYEGSIIMIDINDLKKTNDKLGHLAGDRLIQAAADFLKSGFREKDLIARFGGDEFCILLPDTEFDEAVAMAGRLQNEIAEANMDKDENIKLTISIGIAYAQSGKQLDEAIKLADQKMYADKLLKKNRI